MTMNLDEVLATFFVECRELRGEIETLLLHLESVPDDADAINGLFRAAHTIKGSAGLFGLEGMVAFTHAMESLLDAVRGGQVAVDGEMFALLLESCDHVGELADHAEARPEAPLEPSVQNRGEGLEQRLRAYIGGKAVAVKPASADVEHQPADTASDGGGDWHLSLRFDRDILKYGMEPLSFIRYLGTLGRINHLITLLDGIPSVEEMDPECCYLGFEISLNSEADKETLAGVFDFARTGSVIRILPPHSKVSDYIELIQALDPDNGVRLGEILIASGALTRSELDEGLRTQREMEQPPEGRHEPLGEILTEQRLAPKETVDAALAKQKEIRELKVRESQYVRVQADKLDHLINLVGELVIAGASAHLLARQSRQTRVAEATSLVSSLVEDIRDSALRLRMVEIGDTFNRFRRVVHDVSQELGKGIDLEITGADTELDKTVVEKISDPIMHLVRNAMDHGIEPVDIRRARGKPERGTVRLNAYHDSGSIVIEVGDDGGGLDRDKIYAKAIERDIIAPGQNLSDHEIANLIFEPGFSTADQVTNLSGRGVGMDVVKRNITALRGSVDIDSRQGLGSTVYIRLPLTLAIIDGFLVRVGDTFFVVPLDMVVECIELSRRDGEGDESGYINLRDEALPYLRLRDIFREQGRRGRRENIVVVQHAGAKAGLVVDELQGEFQTVIKPLGKVFSKLQGISGSTILGSGEVALILDVPGLVQRTLNRMAKVPAHYSHGIH